MIWHNSTPKFKPNCYQQCTQQMKSKCTWTEYIIYNIDTVHTTNLHFRRNWFLLVRLCEISSTPTPPSPTTNPEWARVGGGVQGQQAMSCRGSKYCCVGAVSAVNAALRLCGSLWGGGSSVVALNLTYRLRCCQTSPSLSLWVLTGILLHLYGNCGCILSTSAVRCRA